MLEEEQLQWSRCSCENGEKHQWRGKEGSRDWPNSLPKGCSTRVVPRNIIFHGKISFEGIRSKIYVCVTFHNSHSSLAFPSIICILFNLAVQVGKTVYLWAKPMWVSSKKILDREKALTHKHFLFHHSPAILVTHSNWSLTVPDTVLRARHTAVSRRDVGPAFMELLTVYELVLTSFWKLSVVFVHLWHVCALSLFSFDNEKYLILSYQSSTDSYGFIHRDLYSR